MIDWMEPKALRGGKMELVKEAKEVLIETANNLKGSARRLFLARAVQALGEGGRRASS